MYLLLGFNIDGVTNKIYIENVVSTTSECTSRVRVSVYDYLSSCLINTRGYCDIIFNAGNYFIVDFVNFPTETGIDMRYRIAKYYRRYLLVKL